MTGDSVTSKLSELKALIQSTMQFIAIYEAQMTNKEVEAKNWENKLTALKAEHIEVQQKSGNVLARASDEASILQNQARELMDRAQKLMDEARTEKAQAVAAVLDAKQRTAKLEADERVFSANQQLFERKKAALNKALGE